MCCVAVSGRSQGSEQFGNRDTILELTARPTIRRKLGVVAHHLRFRLLGDLGVLEASWVGDDQFRHAPNGVVDIADNALGEWSHWDGNIFEGEDGL